jgi:hypothetical protein
MTRRVPTTKRIYRWHTIRCRRCHRRHETERPNTKFCSEACSKAYRRDLADWTAATPPDARTDAGGKIVPDARTSPSESGGNSRSQEAYFQDPQDLPNLDGKPFTIQADTIPGRRWRVSECQLQCNGGMGGWMSVCRIPGSVALARMIAWLSGTHKRATPAAA